MILENSLQPRSREIHQQNNSSHILPLTNLKSYEHFQFWTIFTIEKLEILSDDDYFSPLETRYVF